MPQPLSGLTIGISISTSDDLAAIGMSELHLVDAMTEIARYLLAGGARLLYGGDLRPDRPDRPGFTRVLQTLVAEYWDLPSSASTVNNIDGDDKPLTNVFASPVHELETRETFLEEVSKLRPIVKHVFLDGQGKEIEVRDVSKLSRSPTDEEWSQGLTAMRTWMTENVDARIVLGGSTKGYSGKMPGILEETLLSFESEIPVYVLGGFGGCARHVASALNLLDEPMHTDPHPLSETQRRSLVGHQKNVQKNHLSTQHNRMLAQTPHVDQAVFLLLSGIREIADDRQNQP